MYVHVLVTVVTDIGCHGDALYSLVECFHVPYCQLLVQYGSQQQQVLVKELTTVTLVSIIYTVYLYIYIYIYIVGFTLL